MFVHSGASSDLPAPPPWAAGPLPASSLIWYSVESSNLVVFIYSAESTQTFGAKTRTGQMRHYY